jgi:P-type Ca2+ transporter type 2C
MPENEWYKLKSKEALEKLSTTEQGLSPEEARGRLEKYGPNEIRSKKPDSLMLIFLRQFKSPLIYILLFAGAVSIFIKKFDNAFVIFIVLLINAVMGFFQENKAKKTMEALKKLSDPKASVLRSGKLIEVKTAEIVPGDILLLESGTSVPADGRLIEASRLQVDESSLTGESQSVHKTTDTIDLDASIADRSNIVYGGTSIASGRGKCVIFGTGGNTEIGKIADIISETVEAKTPFQKKMIRFGKFIIGLVLTQIIIAFIIGKFIRNMEFYDIFMVSLSQMVSSIPEGLPVAVTVALAVGMRRMAAKKTYIRKLPAVEGLGSATVICSDKTGTLTKNEMTSQSIRTFGYNVEVEGSGYSFEGNFLAGGEKIKPLEYPEIRKTIETGMLCNNAGINRAKGDVHEFHGDPTEIAYIVCGKKAGLDFQKIKQHYPRKDEIPFESHIQMMLTSHEAKDGKRLVCVKGSPERVLSICGFYQNNSNIKELDKKTSDKIIEKAEDMAEDALRVLAFAYLEDDANTDENIKIRKLKGNMVFTGLIGNIDPPREEVKQAIEECRQAGIRTVMVTGDHLTTAEAVADKLGIGDGAKGITGREIEDKTIDELSEIVKDISVFARIEPKHKFNIVRAFQKLGEVTAMTGDGVNDAPALNAADIGIAMGITGTDAAKESSSMVIADDNFATIVDAVKEGRGITANIRKAVVYLLCSSNTEILLLLTALFAGLPLPLIPIMILWVNLVTDGSMTVPLIMECKEDVMNKPPDRKKEAIVNKQMLKVLGVKIPVMAASLIILFIYLLKAGDEAYARTMIFTALVITQWFNGLSTRSFTRSVFSRTFLCNKFVLIGLGAGIILHLSVLNAPFLQDVFEIVPLKLQDWWKIIGISSIILWAEEIRKFIWRKTDAGGERTA